MLKYIYYVMLTKAWEYYQPFADVQKDIIIPYSLLDYYSKSEKLGNHK